MKQFIFKNSWTAMEYLKNISKEILDELKVLPTFQHYSEFENLSKPFEEKISAILSKYESVIGTNRYSVLGIRSINPLTKLRLNPLTKQRQSRLPVDLSIWASFDSGFCEITISNVQKYEENASKYFNNEFKSLRESIEIEKAYDYSQENFYAGSLREFEKSIYFQNLRETANIEDPKTFLNRAS